MSHTPKNHTIVFRCSKHHTPVFFIWQSLWNRRHVLENSQTKLIWDFAFNLRKMTTPITLDLMLEEKANKNNLDM